MPPKAHGTRQAAKRPRAEAEEEEEVKEEEEAEEEAAGVEEEAAEAAEEKAFVPKRKKQAVKRPPSRPAASTAARQSKPVAAPARKSASKPVRKPGKILKGLTDPIFIAVPEFDHLLAYNSIRGVLDRKGIANDNKSWKDMIKYKFKVNSPPLHYICTALVPLSYCKSTIFILHIYHTSTVSTTNSPPFHYVCTVM